jgi:amino acid adenylation domain-containing protein
VTFEVWGPLLNGGVVEIVSREELLDPACFAGLLRSGRFTVLFLTTALFNRYAGLDPGLFAGLGTLLFGGEAVDPRPVAAVLAAGGPRRLLHVYGPTESTTFASWHLVEGVAAAAATIPIGRPLANTTAHVLDGFGAAVPVGVVGELYLGGAGLAQGYWRRPALTAERFVRHPEYGRLYRTGDLVRRLEDGALVFVGRADDQIKLRGFRIEPGEVEAALRRLPGVTDAAVVVAGEGEQRHLVGYVARAGAAAAGEDAAALRAALRRSLPEALVPSRVLALPVLPLTANGKLDRAALPAPVLAEGGEAGPATPTEELLAGLWCEVLGVERVGRDGDFFELGGHSLQATQLVSRIRTAFAIDLPLAAIFSDSTPRALAAAIDAGRHKEWRERPIVPVRRDTALPMSFAQERLWFLAQLEPENPFYNSPFALRLKGPLDQTALRAAIASLVARHEILRTAFLNDGGRPRQQVLPAVDVSPGEIDLRHLPPGRREAALQEQMATESRTPFADLGRPPLLRITLIRLGVDEHALLLTLHHIVTDGWSLDVLSREIADVYNAHRRGTVPALPPLPVQYADFAEWQRELLESGALEEQLVYWRRKLANAPPMLALPTDHPRPALQRYRGSIVRFAVDRATRDVLHRLGRAQHGTLFMTLLAGFAALLYRYSRQSEIVIGSPIANRRRPELEPLLGFFVNTLALRIELGDGLSFAALLAQVRQTALEAYAHQDLPFERVIEALQPERDLSRSPLFQAMFTLQNMPLGDRALADLEVRPIHVERKSALFDLVLDFWDTADGLAGVLEYDSDLFEPATAQRMTEHLCRLLKHVADTPDAPIDAVPLLDGSETTRLLAFGNGASIRYPSDRSLAAVFEEQLRAAPHRIAAVADGMTLDYAELNRRANRIAHLLQAIGVTAGEAVGVLVPRGLDYIVAVLGVVKAGGAFLPLDPAYPLERLRYMVQDSGIRALLTTGADLASLSTTDLPESLREVVLLSGGAELPPRTGLRLHPSAALVRQPDRDPPVAGQPRDPLYVLYTSGSTGLPKGAVVRHDGALNHIFAEARLLECGGDLVFLQSAPTSSDISVWQCLAPLLLGGRVVVADNDTVCTPRALFDLIVRERVTLIELVPVVLESLLDHVEGLPREERLAHSLRRVMVTGEAVSVALVDRYFESFPDIPLVNAYGPTEAADDVCQHLMRAPLPAGTMNVPIGAPVDNLSVLVLDPRQALVPIGVPGEICVCGIGVGPGYWRQPERTAAAFVPNPYRDATFGDILYRTGDLGRWRPDGSLEFLGRLDDQVKIRGFRIELGEVEASLARHPQVRDAIVVERPDAGGEPQLAAYLQMRPTAEQANALLEDQVALWRDLHERSYGEGEGAAPDPTFNTVGWDSTYTGMPLALAEMRECIDNAVARIIALRPRNLLEIGCGTGLLLYRLVSHCVRYWGTDLSTAAIRQIEVMRERCGVAGLSHASLRVQAAHDFSGLPGQGIDTVVLNSVVQYFPNLDYFLRVLRDLVERCTARAALFVGDVRDLRLLPAYHASVQLFRAEDRLTCAALKARIAAQIAREQELALAPELFHLLPGAVPRLGEIVLRPKRGLIHNEMTRFRYDAVLSVGDRDPLPVCPEPAWKSWPDEPLSLDIIRTHLRQSRPAYWGLRRVADARLVGESRTLAILDAAPMAATVRDLRRELAARPAPSLDPEALWRLADEVPYRVDIEIETGGEGGSFAVLFAHHDSPPVRIDPKALRTEQRSELADCANNPLQEVFARRLVASLRDFLKERLPSQMIPASFTVLERFPLTPNGKVDRRALPPPALPASRGSAPRTEAERIVQSVWADVLGIDQPGVDDNFFELGGHSLKATQVVARLQQQCGKLLALREVFNHPTIAGLAAKLDVERAELPDAAIPATAEAPHYPASRGQRRLWVLSQMGGAAAYHMADALRLRGPFDPAALERAFGQLLDRHEILRTRFVEIEGALRQVVVTGVQPVLDIVDLPREPDPESAVWDAALAHAREDFDLAAAPLLRARLLRLSGVEHVLLFSMHHIIADGWSLDVLVRELMALYTAAVEDSAAGLPPLRIQYRDYVAWQQTRLARHGEAQRAYWLKRLADLTPLDLPTDFPRPPVKTYRGGREKVLVEPAVLTALERLAQARGVSLFMLLTALVKVLLYRYSGTPDIGVGCPVAGRNAPELENQIGLYLNTLVLRDRLDAAEPFGSLLARVRDTLLAAYEHQDYSFDQLVQDLNPSRDASRNPLFDVMIALQNTANQELELPGVAIESLAIDHGTAQFDLLWNFAPAGDGLQLALHYNSDLFRADTVASLLRAWYLLARNAVVDPEQPIGRLPLLTPEERTTLLTAVPGAPQPRYGNLVEWFEAQARARPQAIALTDGERQVGYAELNARANRLAYTVRRRLDAVGGGLGTAVGLCVGRSAEMIVGMLGILKAGAAYVPIDPDSPEGRIRFILVDAGVPLLVTQRGCLAIAADYMPPLIFVDDTAQTGDPGNLGLAIDAKSPAYLIYTSGSTGEPKGVVISHGNVVRLFSATEPWFAFGPEDVWTQFHSYAFDFSVWEIWGALLYGGRLAIVPYLVSRSPDLFLALLSGERVTVLNQTPSGFRQLLHAEREAPTPPRLALRMVVLGGEALEPAMLRPWFARHGDRTPRLVNMYGITETTVHVTYRPLTTADADGATSPIGVPIPDLRLDIFDEHCEPVPRGFPGELHVGGAGLAHGYFRREALTRERFIDDPHRRGGRLYRTGDRVRRRPDGEIEYLGRFDDQVKIRGFRIEAGEVAAALLRHPGVADAAVARQEHDGDAFLVAYYVPRDAGLEADGLRRHLRDLLPGYMIPAHFVALPRLPLTVNGKLDRRALPSPKDPTKAASPKRDQALTSIEQHVLACWQSVLGTDRLRSDDNVFDHGAHSVLAVRVRGLLQSRLRRDIPVVWLFQYTTPAALAAALQQCNLEAVDRPEAAAMRRAQHRRATATGRRSRVDDARSR